MGATAIPEAEDEESKLLCSTSCFRKRRKKGTMIACFAVRGYYVWVNMFLSPREKSDSILLRALPVLAAQWALSNYGRP